jgi:hypothetical protein
VQQLTVSAAGVRGSDGSAIDPEDPAQALPIGTDRVGRPDRASARSPSLIPTSRPQGLRFLDPSSTVGKHALLVIDTGVLVIDAGVYLTLLAEGARSLRGRARTSRGLGRQMIGWGTSR